LKWLPDARDANAITPEVQSRVYWTMVSVDTGDMRTTSRIDAKVQGTP
jgi:hypothetical protein